MNENLINQRYVNNYNKEDIFQILCYDPVYDTLKHIHLKSKFRGIIIKQLLYFYHKHFLLFLIEFLIGLIFLIFPIILNKITNLNIIILYLASIITLLIFYLTKLIFKCYDNCKHKYYFKFVWERSNIITNIYIMINLILIIALFFEIESIFDYINNSNLENENNFDLINEILILLLKNKNDEDDEYYFKNKKEKNEKYYLKTKIFFITLSIFLFFNFLKSFLLKIKYQTEKIIFYFNLLMITLIYNFCFKKIQNEKYHKMFSIIQFILLTLSLFFYIIWIFRYMYKRIIKKREKYFCIKRLSFSFILFTTLNDIFLFFGILLFFIYSLLILLKKNDEIHIKFFNIKNIIIIILIGNCFYFGRNVLEEIYKPLCIQYIPARLKNKYYIKVKRKMKRKINK